MNKRLLLGLLVVVLILAGTQPLLGRGSDGRAPAEKNECVGLRGAPLGLCRAYCEAQECNLHPDKRSCDRLRRNFARLTGETVFPCDPWCGDGVVNENSEECDDGNDLPCDGCSPECTIEFCGDGVVCPPEDCEPGDQCEMGPCSDDCLCPAAAECVCGQRCTTNESSPGICEDVDGDGLCECTDGRLMF